MRQRQEHSASARPISSWRGASAHPDNLRGSTLWLNSIFALVVSAALLPFVLWLQAAGVSAPLALDVAVMVTAGACLGLHRAGRDELVTAIHIAGLLAAGVVFSLAHPRFADFGLATILLAPIYAVLLAKLPQKRLAWGATAVAVGFVDLAHFGVIPLSVPMREVWAAWLSVVTFVVTGSLVTFAAWRLSHAFLVFQRSQVQAFHHLVENIQDAVVRYSAAGEMLFISKSSEALFGCRRYQLAGDGLIERIHVLDRPKYLHALDETRHHGFARVVEIRVRSDLEGVSAFFWIEASLSPVHNARPGRRGYEVVAVLRDVTVRKDYEQEIRKAREAAEAASETKSRFLATIGHELRTPLNAIVGFTEMMLNRIGGELSEDHEEYAQLILQSAQHLLEMIVMLLDMSKIEAGKFELHLDRFNPAGLVEPCLSMMEGAAKERRIAFKRDIAPELPAMSGDERACRQILLNLISNAIKFSPEGGTVTVKMRLAGASIVISVVDQGIGMAPDEIARVGEPFFQAHSALNRQYEGAGLGLSIVRGLVELHGGQLKVASRPRIGTTVSVMLPVSGPTANRLAPPEDAVQPPESAEPPAELPPAAEARPSRLPRTA